MYFVPLLTRQFYLPKYNKYNILPKYHQQPCTNNWSLNSVKGPVGPKTGNLSSPRTMLLLQRK